MCIPRIAKRACVGLGVVLGILWAYLALVLDHSGRPFCHKQVMTACNVWMHEDGGDRLLPNVMGESLASMEVLAPLMNGTNWMSGYMYVAGLEEGDPDHLILLYLKEPTRWIWHGSAPTIFGTKKWLVVPRNFAPWFGANRATAMGECSERLTDEEFASRLEETLAYIESLKRPFAQRVREEHARSVDMAKAK